MSESNEATVGLGGRSDLVAVVRAFQSPFVRLAGMVRSRSERPVTPNHCPNDGSEIPSVPTDVPGIRCFMCNHCGELFIYLTDTVPWRLVASYGYEPSKQGWAVWKHEGSATDLEIAARVVSTLPQQPTLD